MVNTKFLISLQKCENFLKARRISVALSKENIREMFILFQFILAGVVDDNYLNLLKAVHGSMVSFSLQMSVDLHFYMALGFSRESF